MTNDAQEGGMGKETEQAKLLREARDELGITLEELAGRLGVSYNTLRGWMVAEGRGRHREMPETARLLLAYVLKDKPKRRRK